MINSYYNQQNWRKSTETLAPLLLQCSATMIFLLLADTVNIAIIIFLHNLYWSTVQFPASLWYLLGYYVLLKFLILRIQMQIWHPLFYVWTWNRVFQINTLTILIIRTTKTGTAINPWNNGRETRILDLGWSYSARE